MDTIKGYIRPDGQIGIRNHVLVIPSVTCATHVAEKISANVPGAVYLANQYGCGQVGDDFKQTFRTFVGLGKNPNVGAVLVIGLGCELLRPEKLAAEIAVSGKPVEMLMIQEVGGTSATIAAGEKIAKSLMQKINEQQPETCSVDQLILGLECGGSDFTSGLAANPAVGYAVDLLIKAGGSAILTEVPEMIGAEHILARRAVDENVARKLLQAVNNFEQLALDKGIDIRGTQPSPGNIEGGLTTIEEKSLGCVYKAGTNVIKDVVDYSEPVKVKGLTIMDGPGHDVQTIISMLAGGAQVAVFTTGRGTPVGAPIAPVIKVTGNRTANEKMRENIDVYVGEMIYGESSLEEEGKRVYDQIIAAANGQLTCSEKLGHREFGVWRTIMTI